MSTTELGTEITEPTAQALEMTGALNVAADVPAGDVEHPGAEGLPVSEAPEATPAKPKRTRRSAKAPDTEPPEETEALPDTDEAASAPGPGSGMDTAPEAEASPAEAPADAGTPNEPDRPGIDPDTGLRMRRVRRREGAVTLDNRESTLTDAYRSQNDLLDLTESMRARTMLTGHIQGIECIRGTEIPEFATLYYGSYKVIIPVDELISVDEEATTEYRGAAVSRRLGAEIDYVVKGIDQENRIAAASRLDAMAIKRREFFQRKDYEGNTIIREGSDVEARVVSVISYGVFVEVFGVESFIPRSELSLVRMADASERFRAGDRTLVRVLRISSDENGNIRLRLSVRQAHEEFEEAILSRFVPDNLYSGTVSMVSLSGVHVNLGDASCLCPFPRRGRPTVGARVCVRVRGVNLEEKQIWGIIIR